MQTEKQAKAQAKEDCRKERERKREESRLAAAGAPEHLKSVVREKGWVTGRGAITKTLLEQVLRFFHQSVNAGEKVEDLVVHSQHQLGWDAQSGFRGDPKLSAPPLPAPSPPPLPAPPPLPPPPPPAAP
mmetsp:Transcript_11799/g.24337  ORF Transcript_11799/g.24337 Transcript_11799/m.24337 type:complete len:129 (+) Transcript_11799:293-679(+)